MIGESTGLTYRNMKPYEVAEIVGFRESFDPLEVEKSFGSLLYHDGKEVILLRNNNNYFYVDSEPNTFKNQLYEIKIVYSPHKETKPLFFFIWTTLFLFIISVGIFSCWVIHKILEHFQIVQ